MVFKLSILGSNKTKRSRLALLRLLHILWTAWRSMNLPVLPKRFRQVTTVWPTLVLDTVLWMSDAF